MKKIILITLFIYVNVNKIYSQTPPEIIDSFFKIYKNNEPIKALDDLYKHAPWLKDKNEGVENLKIKFNELQKNVGIYYGNELLSEKNVKNTFVVYTYLVKFENNPIVFIFEFYKPNKDWTVYSFSYDDSLPTDVEHKAKTELFDSKK